MQMRKRLFLQDLADYLAGHEGIARRDAETFVRAFFDVVEEGLIEEKFVKIKGLGTFKLVTVSERESVNINTGERFQISGHTKVSFTPDMAMKELVNRPFAHFETVDLSEETDTAEFDTIDEEMAADEAEQEELHGSETEEETSSEKSGSGEEEILLQEAKDEEGEEEVAVAERSNEAVVAQEVEEPKVSVEAVLKEDDEEASSSTDILSKAPGEAEGTSQAEEETAIEVSSPVTIQQERAGAADEEADMSYSYTYKEEPPRRKRNGWKMAAIVLAVVLLMVISYFAGYFRVLCPCSFPYIENLFPSAPARQPASTAPKKPMGKSVAPFKSQTARREKPAPSMKKDTMPVHSQPQKGVERPQKEMKPQPPQRPEWHVVRAGDNLTKISRRYYGSDKYVSAIIKANGLKNADSIVLGMRLKLP